LRLCVSIDARSAATRFATDAGTAEAMQEFSGAVAPR